MDGVYKSGGGLGGGAAPPICKHKDPGQPFPNSEHGDDMMLVFFLHAWISNCNIHNDTNTDSNKY